MLLSGAMGPDPSDRRLREDDGGKANNAQPVRLCELAKFAQEYPIAPAQAGAHSAFELCLRQCSSAALWVPAFARTTEERPTMRSRFGSVS